MNHSRSRSFTRSLAVAIFFLTGIGQLWLVAKAGTDIPFDDQWAAEGQLLYSRWCSGTLRIADLFQAHNEHRIVWTHLWNLFLFIVDGQWDPSVQQLFNIPLRAASAVLLFWLFGTELSATRKSILALAISLAFLPFLSWQNVLWGFQSQVWFSIILSIISLRFAARATVSRDFIIAALSGATAELAMGSGFLIPIGMLALCTVRFLTRTPGEKPSTSIINVGVVAILLLVLAAILHVNVTQHEQLHPNSILDFLTAFAKALAWPEFDVPFAALIVGSPFACFLIQLWREKRSPDVVESSLIAIGFWVIGIAGAAAWSRGGSPEFDLALPSRYTDFIALWPLLNAVCILRWFGQPSAAVSQWGKVLAALWGTVIVFCWIGDNAYIIRGLIIPRIHDREAPIRVAREFQITRDSAAFIGKPRLYIPSTHAASILSVLDDPALKTHLPPSFQPEAKLGFTSIWVVFIRNNLGLILVGIACIGLVTIISLLSLSNFSGYSE